LFCDDILEEKSIQVKWPIINNNEKQNENLLALQQLKNFDNENDIPSPLIINNNQAYLIDNFHLIKQRYSSLADFNLSRGMSFSFVSTFVLFYFYIQMGNNYELHSNRIIYLSYWKQLLIVEMEKVGKVRLFSSRA